MHLSPQYFIIVKIIWVFLSYLFHRNLQKVLFLYKLSLKVANIEILQKPSILKVIFSKNLQKGSIWRLNAQKNLQKPSTWRLNAQKTFKNLRPEGSDLRPGLLQCIVFLIDTKSQISSYYAKLCVCWLRKLLNRTVRHWYTN